MENLSEATRSQLIAKSKSSRNGGQQRFKRRTKSSIANSVKEFNSIDMNQLFKDNILTVNIKIHGETSTYLVTLKFGGIIDTLADNIERNNGNLDLRIIIRSIAQCFNSDNVYIGCQCPDFRYRFGYFSTINDFISIDPENRPSNITNPNDDKGSACKHVLLVLSNTSWMIKVASVIKNYINYVKIHYQKAYADIIYPALYNKKYEEPVQLSTEDSNELTSDETEIDKSNKYAVDKSRFQKGNTQGVRFAKSDADENQSTIFDET